MIQFVSVIKKYGQQQAALDDISFTVDPGEFVFIVGPSGAGKSTLLKLITRETIPTSGRINFNGEDITKLPSSKIPILRRRIGTVFQDFKLLLTRTVFENVAVPLEVLSAGDAQIEKEVALTLEKVGIADKANSFPAQLAGGESQRTAIARALVAKPEVLLADEPTGDLDPNNSVAVVALLEKINKEEKTTILMATHNAHIVNTFKKRVITLSKGKITSDEKLGRYETN